MSVTGTTCTWMGSSSTHVQAWDGGAVVTVEGCRPHEEQLIHRHGALEYVLKQETGGHWT